MELSAATRGSSSCSSSLGHGQQLSCQDQVPPTRLPDPGLVLQTGSLTPLLPGLQPQSSVSGATPRQLISVSVAPPQDATLSTAALSATTTGTSVDTCITSSMGTVAQPPTIARPPTTTSVALPLLLVGAIGPLSSLSLSHPSASSTGKFIALPLLIEVMAQFLGVQCHLQKAPPLLRCLLPPPGATFLRLSRGGAADECSGGQGLPSP